MTRTVLSNCPIRFDNFVIVMINDDTAFGWLRCKIRCNIIWQFSRANFSRWAHGLCFTFYVSFVDKIQPYHSIQCKEPIPDRVLPDHVIRTEKVLNEGGCRVKCFLEPKCVSINVGPGGARTRTCKLNNATDESPSLSSLKKKEHYIHL